MVNKKNLKNVSQRSFLVKDRDSFFSELTRYSRTFFRDRIQDLSETSVAGMFNDYASFIGDTMSFYLDHQFHELNPETSIETRNIQRHLKNAGVKITGASPASVDVSFSVIVPAVKKGTKFEPNPTDIPEILEGTICLADNGTRFELTENLDFSKKDRAGNFKAELAIEDVNGDGSPANFSMTLSGLCVSGFRTTETFSIENTHVPFRKISLSNENITEVVSVSDVEGNVYNEVEHLTQDTVFKKISNANSDSNLVDDNLEIKFSPHRFVREFNFNTKLTTIQFGAGKASALDDDIVPDPSEFAVPLFGKKSFSRFSLDPGNLLDTKTLGVAPINTKITVDYRHGGGLSHNVGARAISTLETLLMRFPGAPTASTAASIRATTSVSNASRASGGENAPTLTELKNKIINFRNSQSRIVSKEDLISRVYTMPSNFGRVFRASVRSNPNNPLATQLFIISRDEKSRLIPSPDTLKLNLSKYLNQFRMISDAIDILDAQVINIAIEYQIVADVSANRNLVLQNINKSLKEYFNIKNFQIDQPISVSDVENLIYRADGVVSLSRVKFKNLTGKILNREYSDIQISIDAFTKNKVISPPRGGIFEMRHFDFDIVGSAV